MRHRPLPQISIVGPRNREELAASFAALELRLTPEENALAGVENQALSTPALSGMRQRDYLRAKISRQS